MVLMSLVNSPMDVPLSLELTARRSPSTPAVMFGFSCPRQPVAQTVVPGNSDQLAEPASTNFVRKSLAADQATALTREPDDSNRSTSAAGPRLAEEIALRLSAALTAQQRIQILRNCTQQDQSLGSASSRAKVRGVMPQP
jgi:hypothetical protein